VVLADGEEVELADRVHDGGEPGDRRARVLQREPFGPAVLGRDAVPDGIVRGHREQVQVLAAAAVSQHGRDELVESSLHRLEQLPVGPGEVRETPQVNSPDSGPSPGSERLLTRVTMSSPRSSSAMQAMGPSAGSFSGSAIQSPKRSAALRRDRMNMPVPCRLLSAKPTTSMVP